MLHRDAIENLWRYLKMSVTPKLHLLFVHLLRFMEQVQGFGDLGEDAGERAHQEEARNESRVGTVVNLAKTIKQGTILRPPFFRLLTYPFFCLQHPLHTRRSGSKLLLVTGVINPLIPPLHFYEEKGPCYRAGKFLELGTQGLRLP